MLNSMDEDDSSDLFPEGRTIYYEGDDPDGFANEMMSIYGLDVKGGGWRKWIDDSDLCDGFYSYRFHCPNHLMNAVYWSGSYPLGS